MSTSSTKYGLWIDGATLSPTGHERIERHSPGNDQLVSTYIAGTADDVDAATASCKAAFASGAWSRINGAERAAVLSRTAELIKRNALELAEIETLESGKPISQARDEMGWAAGIWDYAAALARQLHGESYNTLGEQHLGMTLREPIGVVGLITPWNFPLLIISQKLPFALAAGCSCVVKPSEFTSGTTLRLAELLKEAGLPDGVCNVVTGYGDPVGKRISEHPDIAMVSFTGSTAVGKRIVSASADTLKKVSLELGGKNPQILFPDADLEAAADAIVFGVFFNMGECCNSGSRILVHEDIADTLVEKVIELSQKVKVGDPMDESVKVGAIINKNQFDKICSYIKSGAEAGAKIVLGGKPIESASGSYIQPTLIDQVTPDMSIASEEIFGPVLSILRFKSEEEAVEIANDVAYGLSASVWTKDLDRALNLSQRIEAGTVWVNCFMDGFQELPFGGYKQSGLGRELGKQAVEDYTETKTLLIHKGPRTGMWVS